MAKQPNHSAASLSGRPKAFSHVKSVRPGFQQAASGARERKQVHAKAPQLKKQFSKAHEGPREKLAKPKRQHVPTPKGKLTQEVHTQVEREKRARNQQKDLQMKKWRERKVPQASRVAKPKPMLKKTQPDIQLNAEKKRTVQEIMQAKQAQRQRRGRSR